MKKKLLALIAAAVLVAPFTANALNAYDCSTDSTCYVYTAGEKINFLTTQANVDSYKAGNYNVGQEVIVLEDKGSSDKYVRAMMVTPYSYTGEYYDVNVDATPAQALYKEISANAQGQESWEFVKKAADGGALDISMITVAEIKTIWGATFDGTKYVIDMTKVDSGLIQHIEASMKITSLPNIKNGFYTSTLNEAKDKVWTVKFATTDGKITGMTVEEVPVTSNEYAVLPVFYFDKNYECKDRTVQNEYACYSCGEEYTWTEVGKQADTCQLVGGITSKAKCVKNAKTGVEDYIVEFVGVTGICAVALVLAKRKELFKSI